MFAQQLRSRLQAELKPESCDHREAQTFLVIHYVELTAEFLEGTCPHLVVVILPYVVICANVNDESAMFRSLKLWIEQSALIPPCSLENLQVFARATLEWEQLCNDLPEIVSRLVISLDKYQVVAVDLLRGEIVKQQLLMHPHVQIAKVQEVATVAQLGMSSEPLMERSELSGSERIRDDWDLKTFVGPLSIITAESAASDEGVPSALAQVQWRSSGKLFRTWCGGRGSTPESAKNRARLEAIERFCVIYPPANTDLITPRSSSHKCLALEDMCLPPGLDQTTSNTVWTPVRSAMRGEQVLVPAFDIWFEIPGTGSSNSKVEATTSGTAVGASVTEASLYAALETLERDAFLTRWYLRKAASTVDIESADVPVSIREAIFRLKRDRPNYRITVHFMSLEVIVPVFTVVATRLWGEGGRIFHVSAAALTAAKAIKSCLDEMYNLLSVRLTKKEHLRAMTLADNPALVSGAHDHLLLFAGDGALPKKDFLTVGRDVRQLSFSDVAKADLLQSGLLLRVDIVFEELISRIRNAGMELFLKNISHAFMSGVGLVCMRAIITGCSVMWYSLPFRRENRSCRFIQLRAQEGIDDGAVERGCHPFC